jgi:hypothetical protein
MAQWLATVQNPTIFDFFESLISMPLVLGKAEGPRGMSEKDAKQRLKVRPPYACFNSFLLH